MKKCSLFLDFKDHCYFCLRDFEDEEDRVIFQEFDEKFTQFEKEKVGSLYIPKEKPDPMEYHSCLKCANKTSLAKSHTNFTLCDII